MITQQNLQRQHLQISPQQIQVLNFFALNSIEIEQRIKTELEENPVLEIVSPEDYDDANANADDIPDCKEWEELNNEDEFDKNSEYQNYISREQIPSKPIACQNDFKDDAKQQLSLLTLDDHVRAISEYLIDTLNDRGILDRPIEEIAEEFSFHQQKMVSDADIASALKIVQSLEPVGIGTRSIQECLLVQLHNLNRDDREVAIAIKLVEHHYNELINCQFEKIYNSLRINSDILKNIFSFLSKMKMYPVSDTVSSTEPKQTIVPDFVITCNEAVIEVSLNSSRSDSLFINNSLYNQISGSKNESDNAAKKYVQNKINSAQWFINTIKQRETTMLNVMKCIVDFQYEYFLEGDISRLKPMVLRNIGDLTGYDLSTVSRITTNKYAETHFGIICLKDIFSEGIVDQAGQVISCKVIQSIIREAISNEDKNQPYTDQQLVAYLNSLGYNIARRTVAKYREVLNIPVAQIRHVLI